MGGAAASPLSGVVVVVDESLQPDIDRVCGFPLLLVPQLARVVFALRLLLVLGVLMARNATAPVVDFSAWTGDCGCTRVVGVEEAAATVAGVFPDDGDSTGVLRCRKLPDAVSAARPPAALRLVEPEWWCRVDVAAATAGLLTVRRRLGVDMRHGDEGQASLVG